MLVLPAGLYRQH